MNGLLALLSLITFLLIVVFVPTVGPTAVLLCIVLAFMVGIIIYSNKSHGVFLLRLFVAALLVRVVVGTTIYVFNLQEFFGGDALTYDSFGYITMRMWQGQDLGSQYILKTYFLGGGWGMLYMIAAIYTFIGRNPLAIQLVNSVIGASTAPILFFCAQRIFNNFKVAQVTGFFVAFYPSLVLWSSQGLKDGPIVFLLALIMLCTLRLGEGFDVKSLLVMSCSMYALLSLRFYIFYMIVVSVGGSFIIGMRAITTRSLLRQILSILVIGVILTYMGVLRTASVQVETFGRLEAVQSSRLDQAQTASTGFAKDVDVSTTSGALSTIPIGMLYLLFAPFPWQLVSLRQSITLPEMVVWWASFPLFILGLWFTIKYRLRQALPILLFTMMLTVAYSIFQGNIGTAYRQRAQLLVFYFIFISVGLVLLKERYEDRKQQKAVATTTTPVLNTVTSPSRNI